jgi:hypothetical protein
MKTKQKRETITIRLNPEVINELKVCAEERGFSIGKIIEKCLRSATTLDYLMNGIEYKGMTVEELVTCQDRITK